MKATLYIEDQTYPVHIDCAHSKTLQSLNASLHIYSLGYGTYWVAANKHATVSTFSDFPNPQNSLNVLTSALRRAMV